MYFHALADYTTVEFPGPLDTLIHVSKERHESTFTEWCQFQWLLLIHTPYIEAHIHSS